MIVGLGFGASFVPIYLAHPDVTGVGICETDPDRLREVGDAYEIADRYASLEEVLGDDQVDAVHLLTPVPLHVPGILAILGAGKHCAYAVPAATNLDGLRQLVAAERESGRVTMMMETGVYTREFLFARDLHERGEFGRLTFLRGAYYQDLEGSYPHYWRSVPPMHYATHIVAPILALAGTRATRVSCLGSGRLREDLCEPGMPSFPLQTAILRLDADGLATEITHSWFQVAREYTERFSVYGDRRGFEWAQLESEEDHVLFTLDPLVHGARGRSAPSRRIEVPFRPDRLPPELHPFAEGGHGGSHPHLVHEFVRSAVEGRPSAIDAVTAADWCAPGICAHESSLRDGDPVTVPSFRSP